MRSPGFVVHNETLWPVEVSLEQVGPLYWGVVPPGGVFTRNTGAVWFTLRGRVSLDGKGRITMGDVVWPIAAIVGEIALAALVTVVTLGAGTGEVIAAEVAAEVGTEVGVEVGTEFAVEGAEVMGAAIGEALGEAELAMPAMSSAVLSAASPASAGIAGTVMSAAEGVAAVGGAGTAVSAAEGVAAVGGAGTAVSAAEGVAAVGGVALAASGVAASGTGHGVATAGGTGAVLRDALARSDMDAQGITVDDVYVGGRSLPELIAAGDAQMALAAVFSKANSSVSESGCYAGPDWPFRRRVHEYVISGGPALVDRPGGGVDLVPQALRLR